MVACVWRRACVSRYWRRYGCGAANSRGLSSPPALPRICWPPRCSWPSCCGDRRLRRCQPVSCVADSRHGRCRGGVLRVPACGRLVISPVWRIGRYRGGTALAAGDAGGCRSRNCGLRGGGVWWPCTAPAAAAGPGHHAGGGLHRDEHERPCHGGTGARPGPRLCRAIAVGDCGIHSGRGWFCLGDWARLGFDACHIGTCGMAKLNLLDTNSPISART